MSLVAPQDNTLVMYYNSNVALSGWTLALQILNLIFLLALKQLENPFAKQRWALAQPTLSDAFRARWTGFKGSMCC